MKLKWYLIICLNALLIFSYLNISFGQPTPPVLKDYMDKLIEYREDFIEYGKSFIGYREADVCNFILGEIVYVLAVTRHLYVIMNIYFFIEDSIYEPQIKSYIQRNSINYAIEMLDLSVKKINIYISMTNSTLIVSSANSLKNLLRELKRYLENNKNW
ncbi:MAG: hypothetical protein ACTSUL_01160 [Promethearchaeota archaeon]